MWKQYGFWFVALLAIFNDLILIIGHDTLYIEEFYPHFDITHNSLSCKVWFLHPTWVFGLLKWGALVNGRIFLACLAFLLKEGLQLGFAYAFHHDM